MISGSQKTKKSKRNLASSSENFFVFLLFLSTSLLPSTLACSNKAGGVNTPAACDAGCYSVRVDTCSNCDTALCTSSCCSWWHPCSCNTCSNNAQRNTYNRICSATPAGKWSGSNDNSARDCRAGRYGSGGSSSDSCSGQCLAGRFGSAGQTTSACSGECAAGRYGSNSVPVDRSSDLCSGECLAGTFSGTGAASCLLCNAGSSTNGAAGGTSYSVCQQCAAGEYAPYSGSAYCTKCVEGKSSSAVGQTSATTCVVCGHGKYADSEGSSSCDPCEAGKIISDNSNLVTAHDSALRCTSCAAGKYANIASAAYSCVSCGAGKYSESIGAYSSDVCQNCPKGSYNTQSGSANINSCSDCDAGKAGNVLGSTTSNDCIYCAAGRYSGEGLAFSSFDGSFAICTSCDAGHAAANNGATSCQSCPAGTYSAADFKSCISCPTGKFNGGTGDSAASCVYCPQGKYVQLNVRSTGTAENQNCEVCGAGKYSEGNDDTGACTNCPVGRYISNTAVAADLHDNLEDCNYCPAGRYNGDEGASICSECDVGTYSNTGTGYTTASQCSVCPSGTYRIQGYPEASPGTSCNVCSSGKYLPNSGSDFVTDANFHDEESDCLDCPTGKSTNNLGQSDCSVCNVGLYQDEEGRTDCKQCPKGRFNEYPNSVSSTYHDSSDDCEICANGRYAPNPGMSACDACPSGKYLSDVGITDLDERLAKHDELSDCAECQNGKWSVDGAAVCTDCGVGKYLNSPGTSADSCQSCVKGRFAASEGRVSCSICSEGKYADALGQSSCENCLAGRFQRDSVPLEPLVTDHDDEGDCLACDAGMYTASEGSTSCANCNAGSTSPSGSATCTLCDAGRYTDTAGEASCTACAAGRYTSTTGSSGCTPCDAGSYQENIGQESCILCEGGKYSVSPTSGFDGITDCITCVAGKYTRASSGATSCDDCDAGYFSSAGAHSACTPCQPNTYNEYPGSTYCELCPPGQTSPEGSTLCSSCAGVVIPGEGCVECTPGQYAAADGCNDCHEGSRSSGGAVTSCTQCLAGEYSADSSGNSCDSACSQCRACSGTTFSSTASSSCTSCPSGTFPNVARTACTPCDAGTYAVLDADADAISCVNCSPGKYSSSGASSCTDCVGGKYSGVAANLCNDCGPGRYSGAAAPPPCPQCPVGRYSDDAGMSVCSACPAGKSNDEIGQEQCTDCEAGKRSISGEECTSCPAGKSSSSGAHTCDDCPAGSSTQGGVGSSSCSLCEVGKYSATPGWEECQSCSSGYHCTEGSISPQENRCGAGESAPANFYCANGIKRAVTVGYYSTPTNIASDVREGQASCGANYFCYAGTMLSFFEFTNDCSTDSLAVELDVPENSASDAISSVATFTAIKNSAIDPSDLAIIGSVSYEVVSASYNIDDMSGSHDCATTIDDFAFTGGALKINGATDYETCKNGINIEVRATADFQNCEDGNANDPCTTQNSEICEVNVRLRNTNEPPSWLSPQTSDPSLPCYMDSLSFDVYEKTSEFTEFGHSLETCVADPDESETITFAIEENGAPAASLFDVKQCGGKLFVKEDADLMYSVDGTNSYEVTIIATDAGGSFDKMNVTVNVLNINDPPTFIPTMSTTFSIDENRDVGTVITNPTPDYAIDLDNDALEYSLLVNTDNAFTIDAISGALSSTIMFDYETKHTYLVQIQVTDNKEDSPVATSSLITVNINDVNDQPYFTAGSGDISMTFTFPETTSDPDATTVTDDIVADLQSLANDQDTSDNFSDNTLVYTLLDRATNSPSTDFSLTSDGVKIIVIRDTTTNPFDFEDIDNNEFHLTLSVRDDDGVTASNELHVKLKLTNVNEMPTFVDSSPITKTVLESICGADAYPESPSPNIPSSPYALLFSLRTFEPDEADETFLTITTPGMPLFVHSSAPVSGSPGETMFNIYLQSALDHETQSSYTFSVEVSDGQLKSSATVNLNVNDCNEPPTLVVDQEMRNVTENFVGEVSGPRIGYNDLDANDGIVYEIVGGLGNEKFSIDNNGVLSTTTPLNFETGSLYYIEIRVTDDPSTTTSSIGQSSSSAPETFTVNVLNANEAPSVEDFVISVTESTNRGDFLFPIQADDEDLLNPFGDDITFNILSHDYVNNCASQNGNGECCTAREELFDIVKREEDSIVVFKNSLTEYTVEEKPLNNLKGCLLSVNVRATDSQGLVSNTAVLSFNVSGTNSAPQLDDAAFGVFPHVVEENVVNGTIIATGLNGFDEDIPAQALRYIIYDQGEMERFEMEPATGKLTVTPLGSATLDFETEPVINITAYVMDDQVPFLFDSATITIRLTDVNEPPTFLPVQAVFSIDENADTSGSNIDLGSVIRATDPDVADVNNLQFTMTHDYGDNMPFVLLNSHDAAENQNVARIELSQHSKIDHEDIDAYTVNVIVTDHGGLSASIPITIFIGNVNEPPIFAMCSCDSPVDAKFYLPENAGGGYKVGELKVIDPENDAIEYSITSDPSNKFTINENGEIYSKSGAHFDYEDETSYTLSMEAKESGAEEFSVSTSFTVYIVDINDMVINDVRPTLLLTSGEQKVYFVGSDLGPIDEARASSTYVTASYIGGDGVKYSAKDCNINTTNTVIECTTVAGVGKEHIWNITVAAPGTNQWSVAATDTSSYFSPIISSVHNSSSMPTAGGFLVTILGQHFGPIYNDCTVKCVDGVSFACGDECKLIGESCDIDGKNGACDEFPDWYIRSVAEVTYGPNEEEVDKYVCTEAKVVQADDDNFDKIVCKSAEGVGRGFFWSVKIGARGNTDPFSPMNLDHALSSNQFYEDSSSYRPPSVELVVGGELPNSKHDDSASVMFRGDNFGIAGSEITITYGDAISNSAGDKYTMVDCVVLQPHVVVNCSSVPGVGFDLRFSMAVAGLSASLASTNIRYKSPFIKAPAGTAVLNAVFGQGATGANTRGGEELFIFGTNFGPSSDPFPPRLTYGPTGSEYEATDCLIVNSFNKIRCYSASGTGIDHSVIAYIGGQQSQLYLGNVSYAAPSVHYFEPEWREEEPPREGGATPGSERVIVHGDNFGEVSANKIDRVSYGENGVEYMPCKNSLLCDCTVVVDHTEMLCNSTEGTGKHHRWIVTIDGQNSTVSTTNYNRPKISTVIGMIDAHNDGGEPVTILGTDFGESQSKLESVTYGPSGTEFNALDCLLVSHFEIRCKTSPGLGDNLKWSITVDKQTSDLSDVSTNYKTPSIVSLVEDSGETQGQTVHVINGTHLAVNVPGSYIEVLMDGEPIPLDGDEGSEFTKAVSGSYLTGRDGDMDFIKFTLPQLKRVPQEKVINVRVGHIEKLNVEQSSNTLPFEYGDPIIDTIENIEGPPVVVDVAGSSIESTTDLVIRGSNFGLYEYSDIRINDEVQDVTLWSHKKIKLNYVGDRGNVTVRVGNVFSNTMKFLKRSPELYMEEPFVPSVGGYRTVGEDSITGLRNLTLAGCYFNPNPEHLDIEIDGVECEIFDLSLTSLPTDFVGSDGRTASEICPKDTLRSVTCAIPEGTGEVNEVLLFSNRMPNFTGNKTLVLNYLAPNITMFVPNSVDTRGEPVRFYGDNFGDDVDKVLVLMGDVELPIRRSTFTHTSFIVDVPSGEGRPRDVMITVDGQSFVVDAEKEFDKILKYNYPIIETLKPNLIPTTGANLTLGGKYFGREGVAEAYMTDISYGRNDNAPRLPFGCAVQSGGNHSFLQINISPGQGLTNLNLNVSKLVSQSEVSFFPPTIEVEEDSTFLNVGTQGGDLVTLTGSNFGVGFDYVISVIDDELEEDEDNSNSNNNNRELFDVTSGSMKFDESSVNIVSFDHEKIILRTEEGQNALNHDLKLQISVANQVSNSIKFNYGAPKINKLVMCFPDSTAYVYDKECEGDMSELGVGCDPYSEEGCGLSTEGGYTVAIIGENFGKSDAGIQKLLFGGKELVDDESGLPQVVFKSHSEIHFRVPPGVGNDNSVVVEVGKRKAEEHAFSYDPPYIERVLPSKPDAEGGVITILGKNFGSSEELAGDISIYVGQFAYTDKFGTENSTEWLRCSPPSYFGGSLPIWNQETKSSKPILWCEMPRVTVGPKALMVSIAGQNVTIAQNELRDGQSVLRPRCSADFYGQEQDAIYLTGDSPNPGMCGSGCEIDSWRCKDSWDPITRNHTLAMCVDEKHCSRYRQVDNRHVNCTVISRHDEYCVECPGGSTCDWRRDYTSEPESNEGYWRLEHPVSEEKCGETFEERKHRPNCYEIVPCAPADACDGANVCGTGYTGFKCNSCCDALHRYVENQYGNKVPNPECWDENGNQLRFFRQYGECAPCPSNPWMIVAMLFAGGSFVGGTAWIMKKKHMSLGILSIAVDYFQILALLSSTKTPWPQVILDLYTWLSAFNFNINITAPECVFEIAYEDKWRLIMMMPAYMIGAVFVFNWLMAFSKKFFFNQHGKNIYSHSHQSVGVALTIMYYIYLNLSMTALEIFNCGLQERLDERTGEMVGDGKQYMQETNWVCYEEGSLQVVLIPHAIVAFCVYTIGFPVFCAFFLFNKENAKKCRKDQILRALGTGHTRPTNPECYDFRKRYHRLYYYYKPDKWYWMLVILARKFLVATISLIFRTNATFQMCMIVLVIFIANTIQVRNQPFMSMSERKEVLEMHSSAAELYQEEISRRQGYDRDHVMISKKNLQEMSSSDFKRKGGLEFFWNYNSVETILLGCAILVNLFGIMFESAFLKEGSAAYETLANVTLMIIVSSLVYLLLVIWSEIVVAVFPQLDCSFINILQSKANKRKKEKKEMEDYGLDDGGKDTTRAVAKSFELEMANMTFSDNPMYADNVKKAKMAEQHAELNAVRNHPEFVKLQSTLQAVSSELTDTKITLKKGLREEAMLQDKKNMNRPPPPPKANKTEKAPPLPDSSMNVARIAGLNKSDWSDKTTTKGKKTFVIKKKKTHGDDANL